jgi:hypothetical protein
MVKLLLLEIKIALNMSTNDVTPNISEAQDDIMAERTYSDHESLTWFKGLHDFTAKHIRHIYITFAVSNNTNHFKSGQKWPKNNHYTSLAQVESKSRYKNIIRGHIGWVVLILEISVIYL